MGKTFRKNDGRRPKWDKRGNKSHKQKEFEGKKSKFRKPSHSQPPPFFDAEDPEDID